MTGVFSRSLLSLAFLAFVTDAEAGPRGGGGGGGRKGGGGGRGGGGEQAAQQAQTDWSDECNDVEVKLEWVADGLAPEMRAYYSPTSQRALLALPDNRDLQRYLAIVQAVENDAGAREACESDWASLEEQWGRIVAKANWMAEAMPELLDYTDQYAEGGDMAKAISEGENAVALVEVALWVDSSSSALATAKANAEAKLAAYKANYAKTLSGAYHADHVGELWFSTAPITLGKEDTAALSQAADASKGVYVAAYYPGELAAMGGNPGGDIRAEVRLWKDPGASGQSDEDYHWTIDAKGATATALTVELWPTDPAKAQLPGLAVKYAEFIRGLGPGTHEVQFQVAMTDPRDGGKTTGAYDAPFAKLSLTVPSDLSGFEANATKIYNTWIDAQRMPKAKKTDSSLSSQLMKAYTEAGWDEKPLRAVIVDSDWTYFYDDWNRPIQRTLRAWVAVDNGDGTCRAFEGIYQADSPDFKNWDAPYLNLITSDIPLACANVNK